MRRSGTPSAWPTTSASLGLSAPSRPLVERSAPDWKATRRCGPRPTATNPKGATVDTHVRAFHLHRHQQTQAGQVRGREATGPELCDFIEANEPRLIAFSEYANEDGTEVGVVQVHRDAESMQFHMEVVAEQAARACAETLDATTSIQFYGTPSDAVLQMLSRQAGAGVPLMVKRYHLGGFTRPEPS